MFFQIFPEGPQCPLCAPHGSISLRYFVILVVLIDSIVGQMDKLVLDILMVLIILL